MGVMQFLDAIKKLISVPLYEKYCEEVSAALGKHVGKGIFGAEMQVYLVNDGPVTIVIDSRIKE